jgi:hypothetical protein
MATSELDELRRRARWLAEHPLGDSPAHAEFRRAMNRLRALTGQAPLVEEALEHERDVSETLLRLHDVVVTLPPLEPPHGRPDFVVTRGTQAVVVKAMAPRGFSTGRARRCAHELAEALSRYGASRAFVVIPDQVYSPAVDSELVPNVELTTSSLLSFVVDRALGGPA